MQGHENTELQEENSSRSTDEMYKNMNKLLRIALFSIALVSAHKDFEENEDPDAILLSGRET